MVSADENGIEARLARLDTLDRAGLTQAWTTCFGDMPPPKTSRQLMIKAIAYRWQEQAYGGLSARTRKVLSKIADTREGPVPSLGPVTQIKTGTRFVREWHGRLIEVSVEGDGTFLWEGRSYASLSAIARKVTNTRRNGPAFFGLREK